MTSPLVEIRPTSQVALVFLALLVTTMPSLTNSSSSSSSSSARASTPASSSSSPSLFSESTSVPAASTTITTEPTAFPDMSGLASKVCAKGEAICIPSNYSKFDLPNETAQTIVNVGIDIKDIPKIDDKEFSITLNAFFVVRWTDKRMIIDQHKMKHIFKKGKS